MLGRAVRPARAAWARSFASDSGAVEASAESKLNDLYMQCLEPKPQVIEPLSEEELARGEQIAKRYTVEMWKRHNILQKDLQGKIRHKWAAIHALPTVELRKEALFVDDPFSPLERRIATWTPPLKGFRQVADVVIEEDNDWSWDMENEQDSDDEYASESEAEE